MPGKRRGLPPRSGLLVFSVLVLCLWWGDSACTPSVPEWATAHVRDLAARPELATSPSSMAFHWTVPNVSSRLAGTGCLSSVQTSGTQRPPTRLHAVFLGQHVPLASTSRRLVQCFVLVTNMRPAHRRRKLDVCSEVTTQLAPPVLLSLSAWLGTRVWVSPIFWAICWGPPFPCQTTGSEAGAGLRVTGAGPRTELLGAAPQLVLTPTL